MLNVRITPGSPAPIYQQITTQVRHAIATGGVLPGELLPSVRSLAERLLINPNTVAKAYSELSRDGLVESLAGKGLVVANQRPDSGLTKAERVRRLDPAISQVVQEAVALNLTVEEVCRQVERKFGFFAAGVGK